MGPLTSSEKQLIIEMKEEGLTLAEMRERTGRNTITIRRYLLSQGYPLSNPPLKQEEKNKIISLFESGYSCSEIARQINRSKSGVNHFLTVSGYDTSSPYTISKEKKKIAEEVFVKTRNCAEVARVIECSRDGAHSLIKRMGYDTQKSIYSWLSDEEIDLVRTMYESGNTAKEILPFVNQKIVCENSIIKIVKDGGIEARGTGYRNVILHEDFFDVIDTEEKAYVIGFLLADGYVIEQKRDRSRTWGIALQTQDKYMLERFREMVGSDNKLCHQRNEYVFTVVSDHMVDMLAKYNIVPRKCKIVSFPYNAIDKKLHRHVVRGLFDGDGCICKKSCSFCGNEIMMHEIQNMLIEEIEINRNKIYARENGVYSFAFSSKKDVTAFYHYLYDDSTIFLTRKRERFEKLPFIK